MLSEQFDNTTVLNVLLGKERFYNFMSKIFLYQPSKEQLDMFIEASSFLAESVENTEGGSEISASLRELAGKAQTMKPDEIDAYILMCNQVYSSLFYIGKIVPVTESNYTSESGLNYEDSYDEVLTEYTQSQYKAEIPDSNEPADHIGFELGFLADVSAKSAKFLRIGNTDEAEKGLAIQLNFMEKHLNRWIDEFCDAVTERGHKECYFHQLTQALKLFVKEDHAILKELVAF